ncbi:MAG: 3-hydroxyisobutyrate dehydrogenase [Geminicoccaceae bacterium]
MSTIAFIGLGNMGGPMAANLVKAGHSVRGFDLDASARVRLGGVGGFAADDLASALEGAQVAITMLPEGRHVRAVYEGAHGLLANAPAKTLLIDCSTIDVDTARAVNTRAAEAGFAQLDAPVSGGVGGAEAGTLTFMVGGDAEAFACAEPILQAMGKAVIHAGDSGAGQAAKICNNMLLGISMIGTCEAFVLADRLGLDRQKLFDISSKASGQCWSLTTYCPVPGPVPTSPANRDYAAGFAADMMAKDLKLAQDAARSSGACTPLGAHASQLYHIFQNLGMGDYDFSAIINLLRAKA